jgi:hypothetical protein
MGLGATLGAGDPAATPTAAEAGDPVLQDLHSEKKNLHMYLKAYERDFQRRHGRAVMKHEDIQVRCEEKRSSRFLPPPLSCVCIYICITACRFSDATPFRLPHSSPLLRSNLIAIAACGGGIGAIQRP